MDKRRFFSKFYIVLLTCSLILPCSKDVNCADWIYFGTRVGGLLSFYDAQSISYRPHNSVRVFTRIIPSDENNRVTWILRKKKTEPNFSDNWSLSIILNEIDCRNRTMKGLQVYNYDAKYEIINTTLIDEPIEHITPGTISETLYKIVCVEKAIKKNRR